MHSMMRLLLLGFATFLLVSMGGAIVAAPVTVPLLLICARRARSTIYRVWTGIVLVLTVGEIAWALTYLAAGESKPAIWAVPLVCALATVVAYARLLDSSSSVAA